MVKAVKKPKVLPKKAAAARPKVSPKSSQKAVAAKRTLLPKQRKKAAKPKIVPKKCKKAAVPCAADKNPLRDDTYPSESRRARVYKPKSKPAVTGKSMSILSKASAPKPWNYRPVDRARMPASFYKPTVNRDAQWVRALAELVPAFRHHSGANIVLNMWSDCAGMGSEIFAMRMLVMELKMLYNVDVVINVVGVCEKKIDCCVFLEENHSPRIISNDMCDRKIRDVDGKLHAYDLNIKTGQYEELPHGIDIYGLGFPCTPWSRRAR